MAYFKKEIIGFIILSVFMIGCQTAPELQRGELLSCFAHRDCLYRNAKNSDKSACNLDAIECSKDRQEERTKKRLEYCEEKTFKGMTNNECRLFLNQK
jgi:hypothetical protein